MQYQKDIILGRLARGEISINEYTRLLESIYSSVDENGKTIDGRQFSNGSVGRLIAASKKIELFENRFVYKGTSWPLEKIDRVMGGRDKTIVNGVTVGKSTFVAVKFSDGKIVKEAETSAWLAKDNHESLLRIYTSLLSLTFYFRLGRLLGKLKNFGMVDLANNGIIKKNIVRLFPDGSIGDNKHRFDIKEARKSGTLKLGVGRSALNQSLSYNPNEIIISDKQTPSMLAEPISGKIRFEPDIEDPDIVLALIDWLSKPENFVNF